MSEAILITPDFGESSVAIVDAARVERDELLRQTTLVTTVTDRIDADDALMVLKSLATFTSAVEAQRVRAKAPALDVCRKIDALAKELTGKIVTEEIRIGRVLGSFETEERRKAEDACLQAEREAVRIAADAARKSIEVRREAKNSLEANRAVDAVVEEAQTQIGAVRQAAVDTAPAKQEGTQVRGTVHFEVTDIKALYDAYPMLVSLEPNGSAIRAILKQNPKLQVPGLNHWVDHKLSCHV